LKAGVREKRTQKFSVFTLPVESGENVFCVNLMRDRAKTESEICERELSFFTRDHARNV